MISNEPTPSSWETSSWYCLRTQTKHEHIAAAHLKTECGIEVYLPRIRFKRLTRKGMAWFTEALFPGYLFARFDCFSRARQVQHSRCVRGIVRFGAHFPTVPIRVIEELKSTVAADEMHVISEDLSSGEIVTIGGGSFHGLKAVVTRVMPAQQRIAVLLDFLGRQTTVELGKESVVREGEERKRLLNCQKGTSHGTAEVERMT